MSRVLEVYLNKILVGELTQDDSGRLSFQYEADYLTTAQQAISVSMPLQSEPYAGKEVRSFFSGLLPDEMQRQRLAQYLGLSDKNPFALLEAVGGECAGALSFYPKGMDISTNKDSDIEVLDESKLKTILALLEKRPLLAGEDGLRLSLAGAQNKLAVGKVGNRIALIKGETPTTHILKPMIQGVKDSVFNELFCMTLAQKIGLEAPNSEVFFLEGQAYFLVERYDRAYLNGDVIRIQQEDCCQAMGVPPEMKYEREGGPSIAQIQKLINSYSKQAAVDQMKFLNLIIFNYLIGNSDAHGKNFSFLYHSPKAQLAPAYYLLSTAVYPELASKMAMKIGGRYKPEEVLIRHWQRIVGNNKASQKQLERQLKLLSVKILEQAEALKSDMQRKGWESAIYTEICNLINSRAQKIRAQF